jgi:hypothetical protein
MAIRVTKAVTKYGVYYAVGDVIDNPTSVEDSLRRIYGWEVLADSPPSIKAMRKSELVELAGDRGFDVDGLTASELRNLLEEG